MVAGGVILEDINACDISVGANRLEASGQGSQREPEFADRYFPWLVNVVARLLGVSRHGSDRDLQRAQGAKSFLALAHRCCAGEDRGRGQTGGGRCREPWADASFFNE